MTLARVRRIFSDRTGSGAVVQTFAANLLIQGANVLCGIVSARGLGPQGRGELAAVIMWPQFLAYALTLGIPVASVYHIRAKPEREGPLATAALVGSVVVGTMAAGIGWLIIPFSLKTYPSGTVAFAQIAVLLAPISLLANTLSVQAQSSGSFRHYNLFRSVLPLLIFIALLVERWLHKLDPRSAALAYLLAGLPATAWNLVWVCKRFHLRFVVQFRDLKTLLNYGVRAWGADLIGAVASQVDRLLVVGLLAPKLMGLYVVAQSAANLLNVIPGAMVPVLMPKAVDRTLPDIISLTGRATRVTLIVLLATGVPLMLVGGFLLRALYGVKFEGAEGVFHLIVLETILDGISYVLSQAFLAAGSPGTLAMLQGASFLLAIPCLMLLVPRWGLMGVGYAVLLATSIRLAFVVMNFPLRLKVRPPSLIPKMKDLALIIRQI